MKYKQDTSIAKPMREQDTGDISTQVPVAHCLYLRPYLTSCKMVLWSEYIRVTNG